MATFDRYLPVPDRNGADTMSPSSDVGSHVGEAQESTGFAISLADIRAMAWRQRWPAAIIVVAAVLVGIVITLLMTPIYQAQATVQIKQESTNIVQGQDVNPATSIADAGRYLQTQQDLVASRSMAERVADKLKLDRSDNFIVAMKGKPLEGEVPASQLRSARHERVVAYLTGNVSTALPAGSRILALHFNSPSPRFAALVANAYADSFIEQNVETSFNSSKYARDFLAHQIEAARARLSVSEQKSIEYARNTQLIDASDAAASRNEEGGSAAGRSLTTASLVGLNQRLGEVRADRIAAESRWRQAQASSLLELPEVVSNASVSTLQQQRAEVASQLNLLRARYEPDHPEVKQAQARLASIDQAITRIATNIRQSLQNAYLAAQRQEADINTGIQSARGEVLGEQQRRVQLNLLAQDVSTNRQTLNDLLQRYNQVNAASGIINNNLSLVDEATVPGAPIKPNPFRNILSAFAIGIALAIAAGLLREGIDDTVRSPEDVENKLRLPVLGSVPVAGSGEITVENIVSNPKLAMAEAYFSIRAALDFSAAHGRPRSFLVTSSAPSEGKTTTAFALAVDYARMGLQTLLIDCDLRRPGVHRLAQLPLAEGLVDVLSGAMPLEKAIKKVPNSALSILTAGKVASNSVQIFSSDVFENFLEAQSEKFDIIILDTAPVMGLADTPLIARSVEGIVLVVEAGRAHRGQGKNTLKRLRDTGGRILGTVITKFDARSSGYGYNYYLSYYDYKGESA